MTRDQPGRDQSASAGRDVGPASASGRDVGPAPVHSPGDVTWSVAGRWREEAYPLVPARPRGRAERDAGEPLDWYAAIRGWPGDGVAMESWEYGVLGTKAFTYVEASRPAGSPTWSGWYLVAPASAGSHREFAHVGPPPPPSSSVGPSAASSGPLFDEGFREEIGHLPTDIQRFFQADYVGVQNRPERWRAWRIRGERGARLRDERWYWIAGTRSASFVGANRELPGYFPPGREWRNSREADQLDQAPWQATARVFEVSSTPVIRTFTKEDSELR